MWRTEMLQKWKRFFFLLGMGHWEFCIFFTLCFQVKSQALKILHIMKFSFLVHAVKFVSSVWKGKKTGRKKSAAFYFSNHRIAQEECLTDKNTIKIHPCLSSKPAAFSFALHQLCDCTVLPHLPSTNLWTSLPHLGSDSSFVSGIFAFPPRGQP